MSFWKLLKKNKEAEPQTYNVIYSSEVEKLIARKYTIQQEVAILRQKEEKPEEYNEYYKYAEECKQLVKKQLED